MDEGPLSRGCAVRNTSQRFSKFTARQFERHTSPQWGGGECGVYSICCTYLFLSVVYAHFAGDHFVQVDGHGDEEILGLDDVHPPKGPDVGRWPLAAEHQTSRTIYVSFYYYFFFLPNIFPFRDTRRSAIIIYFHCSSYKIRAKGSRWSDAGGNNDGNAPLFLWWNLWKIANEVLNRIRRQCSNSVLCGERKSEQQYRTVETNKRRPSGYAAGTKLKWKPRSTIVRAARTLRPALPAAAAATAVTWRHPRGCVIGSLIWRGTSLGRRCVTGERQRTGPWRAYRETATSLHRRLRCERPRRRGVALSQSAAGGDDLPENYASI